MILMICMIDMILARKVVVKNHVNHYNHGNHGQQKAHFEVLNRF